MYKALLFLVLLGLLSCENEKASGSSKEKKATVKAPLQMYQLSEMASFMEDMYVAHENIKEKALKGEAPDTLPYDLSKLHTATFTDAADDDETYQRMAKVFIEYEMQMVKDPEHIKENYNKSVKLCISCHQLKCTGPIPRIKKLLIN